MDNESAIFALAICALVQAKCDGDIVNDYIKSTIEITNMPIDDSFSFMEAWAIDFLREHLTRNTFIDVIKQHKHVSELKNMNNMFKEVNTFNDALNFMKLAKPDFFKEETRPDTREIMELYKMYQNTNRLFK